MIYKKSLVDIIKKNKICIRENPFGIRRLWPYSYIEFFYNKFCNDLYQRNKSPNILEVDQSNNLNIKLWYLFFENPIVDNLNEDEIKAIFFKDFLKYDMIIINEKHLKKNKKILNHLISLLNSDGTIIIENIGQNSKEVIKVYLKYFRRFIIEIFDYRTIRFISNNCILVIKKNLNRNNFFNNLIKTHLLLKFLFIQNFILFLKFILKK